MPSGINGRTIEIRDCVICHKEFSAFKGTPKKTCSPTCGIKLRIEIVTGKRWSWKVNRTIQKRIDAMKKENEKNGEHRTTIFGVEYPEGDMI